MMINKNRFRISNDKKVLHKIGKRWVTVSALTLALLGGAAAASTVTTHAATTTPAVEAQHTDNVKKQINNNLNSAANSNSAKSTTESAQSGNATKPSAVQSSAANMHNALLQNAANQKPSAKSAGSSVASNAPIHQSAQPNSAYKAYLKQNLQLAQDYYGNATSSASFKVASNAPKDNVSASSIASNSSASSVSANNSKISSANQISDKKNKPLMKLEATPNITASGYWANDNTQPKWDLNNGTLTIHQGTMKTNQWSRQLLNYAGDIKSINITSDVVAPQDSSSLFAPSDQFFNRNYSQTKWYHSPFPNLTSMNVSGLDTKNVNNMFGMFMNLIYLTNLQGLNHFNTTNVQSMSTMFSRDISLHTIDTSSFDMSNVNNIYQMFGTDLSVQYNTGQTFLPHKGISLLSDIKGTANWNPKDLKEDYFAFGNLPNLKFLDLSNLNTRNLDSNSNKGPWGTNVLLADDSNLKTIKLGSNTILTNQAFNGDKSLSYAQDVNSGVPFGEDLHMLADGQAHPGTFQVFHGKGGQYSSNNGSALWALNNNGTLYLENGALDVPASQSNFKDWGSVKKIVYHNISGGNNANLPQQMNDIIGDKNKIAHVKDNGFINQDSAANSAVNNDINIINSADSYIENHGTDGGNSAVAHAENADNDANNAYSDIEAQSANATANAISTLASEVNTDNKTINSDNGKISSLNNSLVAESTSASNTIAAASASASNSASSAESQAVKNADATAEASVNAASQSASSSVASLANSLSASLSAASSALNWIKTSGANASAQANDADAWVKANSASLSNASTTANNAKTSADEAISSLNADKTELNWLANSESALSTGSSQANSNAGWIASNSASVSALSQNFHDIYNKIQQDSTALSQAIGSKADTSDLTNKYNALSGDITNASSLASDADKLAKGNAGEISNLKNNTAITFTFTQDGNNILIPVTMTNGYIEANAQSHNGNTYDITNLLDNAVASKGKHAVGTYTVTLGNDNNGDAILNFKAQPQKKFGVSMAAPSANGMTTFKLGTPVQQRRAWNFVQYGLNNRRGLILGADNSSRVPFSNDTAHNVVLANNQAEYTGTITLNFGSRQAKLNFDTGSTNPKVLASDSVNLLNYAQNAQNPFDFTKDNLINGFDTTGFKFDGSTSTPNNQYNFTIQPSDATNQTGADVHNAYNITLNYTAQPVTENIQYMYGSHIENVNKTTTTAKGNDDSQGSWNSTNNLKPGWTLATTDNKFTFTNNGTAEINVAPAQTSDTINYVDQKGNQVGSQTFIGNNYQATDAGNNDINLSDLESVVPSGYKLQNANSDKAIGFDGGTHTVNVIGNARTPKNTVPSSTKPSDANNPKSNKSMTKPTGDSDVLFTINVQDYNADGTKEINHYTKYATESGEVGDPFTIKASDYLTNGFIIDTKKSADNTVNGTISDNQLQPSSVTFNYYAKASSFDPNKAKTDPNYVKNYNADPTTPKPITVQYIGELNGKANQVVKTYNNVITGNTGDTGTLSNIENAASVPTGYTVKGNGYNYTITTEPQTIKVNLNSKTAKQMNNGDKTYKPATPSDKPSSKVPSDNTVKKDASHGFATVIINENVNGKVAHQFAQTVDESNLGVGDGYTIEPTSFTPKGYQVDSKDKALTGTINPDGSLSNGSATFTYDVNDSEIAPIAVTYYNQFGDLIDVNTGKSKLTGEAVSPAQATQTIQSAQLATKGTIGDYVDVTGFLTAPKGHHFNKYVDSSNNNLNHVLLVKNTTQNPVRHLGLTLFEAMPKPQPKPTPKPNSNSAASTITPASASAEIQSAASSAAQSASASASASAASAEQSAVTSAANSAAQNNGSAVTSTEQSMAKADANNEAHDDAAASAARSAAGSAEASAAVSAADEVRSAEATHNDSKAVASVKASAASAERSAAKSAAQSAKASATDSVEDSIASSEDNQEAHASQNSEAPLAPVEHGSQMIGGRNAEPSHEANVQREAASHMVGVSNKLAQPSTTVHASRVGSNDQNANGHKLPQTNEAKAAGLMGAASIMAALGLAGADTDRKRRRE